MSIRWFWKGDDMGEWNATVTRVKGKWFVSYGAPDRLPRLIEWLLTWFAKTTGRNWFIYRDLQGRRRIWFGRWP